MMVLEVDDKAFENFTSMEVTRSIKALAGEFKFQATSSIDTLFPIHTGQKARVLIEGIPVVTGYVEKIDVSYAADSHSISISGRDKTADAIDSSVLIKKFQSKTDLVAVTEALLKAAKIDVGVFSDMGPLPFNGEDVEEASVGTSIHAFIEPYARKLKALQTTDGKGNIVFVGTGKTQAVRSLVQQKGNSTNNLLSASISRDDSARYRFYVVQAQKNMSAPPGEADSGEADIISNQFGWAEDTGVRQSRVLELSMEAAGSATDANQRSAWESNTRSAKSVTYEATLQGFFQDEGRTRLWNPNELVMVSDDYCNMHGQMLINQVSYSQSASGSITNLSCVMPGSYSEKPVTAPRPAAQQEADASAAQPQSEEDDAVDAQEKESGWSSWLSDYF